MLLQDEGPPWIYGVAKQRLQLCSLLLCWHLIAAALLSIELLFAGNNCEDSEISSLSDNS